MEEPLATIASLYAGIRPLHSRKRFSLDVHAIHVEDLKLALTAAHLAGYAAGFRAANGSEQDTLQTEVHLMVDGEWVGAGPEDPETWPNAEVVITAPIPEVELLNDPAMEDTACMLLIPSAVKQRRIG